MGNLNLRNWSNLRFACAVLLFVFSASGLVRADMARPDKSQNILSIENYGDAVKIALVKDYPDYDFYFCTLEKDENNPEKPMFKVYPISLDSQNPYVRQIDKDEKNFITLDSGSKVYKQTWVLAAVRKDAAAKIAKSGKSVEDTLWQEYQFSGKEGEILFTHLPLYSNLDHPKTLVLNFVIENGSIIEDGTRALTRDESTMSPQNKNGVKNQAVITTPGGKPYGTIVGGGLLTIGFVAVGIWFFRKKISRRTTMPGEKG